MQKATRVLKDRKIVIIAAFLIVALGVGYLSQYPINVTQLSTIEDSPFADTAPEPLLGAMKARESSYSLDSPFHETSELAAEKRSMAQSSVPLESPAGIPSVPDTALTFDRLVVFTAKMDVNVTSVRGAIQDLQGIAYALGGYVSDSYVNPIPAGSMTEKGILAKQAFDASVTLRIPSASFNDALNRIGSLGDVISMTTSSRDVTDQYVDLQARIKNLENVLEQYRNIMKNASKTSDILDIQYRIDNIQEQIERLKAQIAQTEKQASFALITVHLTEPFVIKTDEKPIEEKDTLEKAATDVINMAAGIAQAEARGLLVLTVGLLPIYPILAVGYFMYRRFVAKKNKEIEVQ
jgi:hypothetical protein